MLSKIFSGLGYLAKGAIDSGIAIIILPKLIIRF